MDSESPGGAGGCGDVPVDDRASSAETALSLAWADYRVNKRGRAPVGLPQDTRPSESPYYKLRMKGVLCPLTRHLVVLS